MPFMALCSSCTNPSSSTLLPPVRTVNLELLATNMKSDVNIVLRNVSKSRLKLIPPITGYALSYEFYDRKGSRLYPELNHVREMPLTTPEFAVETAAGDVLESAVPLGSYFHDFHLKDSLPAYVIFVYNPSALIGSYGDAGKAICGDIVKSASIEFRSAK